MTKEKQREYDRRKHEEALPAYNALMSCYPFTLDDLPGEIWKDIAGYNGDYQVSTFGRVKRFHKHTPPRILKPQLLGEYLSVNLCIGGKLKHQKVHVLVAKAFIPNPDNKPEVNHDDGNKFNCHVSNLYWATKSENQQHAVKNGLAKSGEKHYKAKIKDEKDIIYIRENPDNLTQEELAEMFGVDQTTISAIQLGKCYQNAGGSLRESKRQRISDEKRAAIRADWATGLYTKAALARKYGCDQKTISNIVNAGQ